MFVTHKELRAIGLVFRARNHIYGFERREDDMNYVLTNTEIEMYIDYRLMTRAMVEPYKEFENWLNEGPRIMMLGIDIYERVYKMAQEDASNLEATLTHPTRKEWLKASYVDVAKYEVLNLGWRGRRVIPKPDYILNRIVSKAMRDAISDAKRDGLIDQYVSGAF